jgi:energy-coupling factor transporter ATP-binding protein EcfA2
LASILLTDPQFIIMDEPEAFLDHWSQNELASIINGLASDNRGILLIAHDLYFLSETVDRIVGLSNGNIIFDIPSVKFFTDPVYLNQLGLPSNSMIQFRQKLAGAGINLTTSSLNPAKILQSLK